MFHEVNFDGIIGPTHNYAGLAVGNLASAKNAQHTANPRQAALQGLEKMRTLVRMGYRQGFLLPQLRPRLDVLRQLGFTGSDSEVINKTAAKAPHYLARVYSASSMWAANAATVTPSPDSADGRVHFTPANLRTTAHRAIEHTETQRCLNTVFADKAYFTVHDALPSDEELSDEGAANHTRLCRQYGEPGIALFTYGRDQLPTSKRFPARQRLAASQAVAKQHTCNTSCFIQQNPKAIDAGAFHNDVVAVGNGSLLFFHQDAFEAESQQQVFSALKNRIDFTPVEVSRNLVSLEDAISSYLFNSQLLASPEGNMQDMRLIAPLECKETPSVNTYLELLVSDHSQPIREVEYVDVRQSMSNGGGPACLRLRVVLSEQELQAVDPRFILDELKIDQLKQWVSQYYRDEIAPSDLADPSLVQECYEALEALTQLLELGSFYDFQR